MKVQRRQLLIAEARQVHAIKNQCNCNELVGWVGSLAFLIGEGIEVNGVIAAPSDWIVKEDEQFSVYANDTFSDVFQEIAE